MKKSLVAIFISIAIMMIMATAAYAGHEVLVPQNILGVIEAGGVDPGDCITQSYTQVDGNTIDFSATVKDADAQPSICSWSIDLGDPPAGVLAFVVDYTVTSTSLPGNTLAKSNQWLANFAYQANLNVTSWRWCWNPGYVDMSAYGCDVFGGSMLSVPVSDFYFQIIDTHATLNISAAITLDFYTVSPPPPPPPQGWDIEDFSGVCIFTTVITATNGTTTTIEAAATANLVNNNSFEIGGSVGPQNWQDVTTAANPWFNSWTSAGLARTGTYALVNVATESQGFINRIQQTITIETAGTYALGLAGRSDDDFNLGSVDAELSGLGAGFSVNSLTEIYETMTKTFTLPAGENQLVLELLGHGVIDDVYLFPVDGDGYQICSSDYYPDPITTDGNDCLGTGGTICLPVPTGPADDTCYLCQPPTSAGAIGNVGYWIAWLGCILRNLFTCNLKFWLHDIENSVMGVVGYFGAYLAWLATTVQNGVNWFAGDIVPQIAGGGTVIIDTGANMIDLFIAVLGFIADIIGLLVNAFIAIINLISSIGTAVIDAFSTAATTPEILGFATEEISQGQLTVDGVTPSKMIFITILPLVYLDSVIAVYPPVALVLDVVMAIAGLFLIIRLLNEWKELISF